MSKTNNVDDTGDTARMILTRLDAIVLLLLSSNKADDKGRIKISQAAPLLHTAGYSPTEIAKLFGKKKAQDVAQYIYKKSNE
jgi:hypothetical protein